MKMCLRCKAIKSWDEFYKNPHSKDGHVNFCKSCKATYDEARYRKENWNNELLRNWAR